MEAQENGFVRVDELERRLGVRRATIRKWSMEGRMPSYHKITPTSVVWIRNEIEQYITLGPEQWLVNDLEKKKKAEQERDAA